MTVWIAFALGGVATYATRALPLVVGVRGSLSPSLRRYLDALPIAIIAALAGAGALPGAQRVVQALARLEPAGEQRGQRAPDRARLERRPEARDVGAVLVHGDLARGHAALDERRARELRLAEDHVGGRVLGLLVGEPARVERVAVAGRRGDPEDLALAHDRVEGVSGVGVRRLAHRADAERGRGFVVVVETIEMTAAADVVERLAATVDEIRSLVAAHPERLERLLGRERGG